MHYCGSYTSYAIVDCRFSCSEAGWRGRSSRAGVEGRERRTVVLLNASITLNIESFNLLSTLVFRCLLVVLDRRFAVSATFAQN
jgi:hypothetical protein